MKVPDQIIPSQRWTQKHRLTEVLLTLAHCFKIQDTDEESVASNSPRVSLNIKSDDSSGLFDSLEVAEQKTTTAGHVTATAVDELPAAAVDELSSKDTPPPPVSRSAAVSRPSLSEISYSQMRADVLNGDDFQPLDRSLHKKSHSVATLATDNPAHTTHPDHSTGRVPRAYTRASAPESFYSQLRAQIMDEDDIQFIDSDSELHSGSEENYSITLAEILKEPAETFGNDRITEGDDEDARATFETTKYNVLPAVRTKRMQGIQEVDSPSVTPSVSPALPHRALDSPPQSSNRTNPPLRSPATQPSHIGPGAEQLLQPRPPSQDSPSSRRPQNRGHVARRRS